MQSSSLIPSSPSFTGHSSPYLVDIVARVVQELRNENGHEDDDIFPFNDDYDDQYSVSVGEVDTHTQKVMENDYSVPDGEAEKVMENEDSSDDDEEFEFAVVGRENDSSPISADEIFFNGQILPKYPLFDRSLLSDDVFPDFDKRADDNSKKADSKPPTVVRRLPLGKLFSEDRDSTSCSSSSEGDDLDGVDPGTYCEWKPKAKNSESSPGRCNKSNSTGNTSKRWKIRNLLHRSNSDGNLAAGKDKSFVISVPLIVPKKKTNNEKVKKTEKTAKVAAAVVGDGPAAPTDEINKTANKGSRRQSYLPYRQDLVGVFANVNGLSRSLHPF